MISPYQVISFKTQPMLFFFFLKSLMVVLISHFNEPWVHLLRGTSRTGRYEIWALPTFPDQTLKLEYAPTSVFDYQTNHLGPAAPVCICLLGLLRPSRVGEGRVIWWEKGFKLFLPIIREGKTTLQTSVTASSLHIPRQIMFWLNNAEQFVPVHQFNIAFEPELKDL